VNDRVTINVKEPPPPPVEVVAVPPPPMPKGPQRWKDPQTRQVRMALISSTPSERVSEVMVYNGKSKQPEYFAVGAEFDGGQLLFVHPTGAIVSRKDVIAKTEDYFLYPIGSYCNEDIAAADARAGEYPQLQLAATRLRAATEAGEPRKDEEAESKRETEAPKATGADPAAAGNQPKEAGAEATPPGGNEEAKPKEGDTSMSPQGDELKPVTGPAKRAKTPDEAFRVRQYQQQKRPNRPPG